MLEKELKNIAEENKRKLLSFGDKISLKDIKNSKMHPAIINYIFRTIDEQLLNDRQLLLEKSKFDYSGEKIENYLKLISDEIKKKNSFDLTQINELINSAVDFNSRFLSQPNHTILDFIFKSKIHEICLIFNELQDGQFIEPLQGSLNRI